MPSMFSPSQCLHWSRKHQNSAGKVCSVHVFCRCQWIVNGTQNTSHKRNAFAGTKSHCTMWFGTVCSEKVVLALLLLHPSVFRSPFKCMGCTTAQEMHNLVWMVLQSLFFRNILLSWQAQFSNLEWLESLSWQTHWMWSINGLQQECVLFLNSSHMYYLQTCQGSVRDWFFCYAFAFLVSGYTFHMAW